MIIIDNSDGDRLPVVQGQAAFRPKFPLVVKHLLGNDQVAGQVRPIVRDTTYTTFGLIVENSTHRYSMSVVEDSHAIHAETTIASAKRVTRDLLLDLHHLNHDVSVGKISVAPAEAGAPGHDIVYGITVPKAGVPVQTTASEFVAFDRHIPQISDAIAKLAEASRVSIEPKVFPHSTPVELPQWKVLGAFNETLQLPPGK